MKEIDKSIAKKRLLLYVFFFFFLFEKGSQNPGKKNFLMVYPNPYIFVL